MGVQWIGCLDDEGVSTNDSARSSSTTAVVENRSNCGCPSANLGWVSVRSYLILFYCATERLKHALLLFIRINRPGGTGRITKIHYASSNDGCSSPVVEGLDVKYTVYSGHDLHLDPDLVMPHVELESRSRRRTSSVQPGVGVENCELDFNQRESKSKKSSTKKPVAVGTKTGSATKKRISLTRRVFSGRKKRGGMRIHPIAALKETEGSPASSIPREIIIETLVPLSTPNSGCSKSLSGPIDCSPLGEDGVESHLVTTASYERMVITKPQRPSVDTANAECLSTVSIEGKLKSDDMELDDSPNMLQLQLSPRLLQQKGWRESLVRSTPLATGRYPDERRFSFEKVNLSLSNPCVEPKDISPGHYDVDVLSSRAKVSLRDIYDQEREKASNFIGSVVKGSSLPSARIGPSSSNEFASMNTGRLNEFRSLLNDYLHESDGMVQSVNLADQLAQFSISSGCTVFDFTETEVDLYLTQLCGQNKIMQTEGWIYNI
jgi:hypothetical protein